MLKIKKLFILGLTIIFTLNTSISAFAEDSEKIQNNEKIKISFVDDVTPSDFQNFVNENSITLDSFIVKKDTGDQVYTIGYVINEQNDFSVLWNDFVEKQYALIKEGLQSFQKNPQIASDLQILQEALSSNELTIEYIICDSTEVSRNKSLEQSSLIKDIQVIEKSATQPSKEQDREISIMASNWVPTSGSASAWPSQNVEDATYMEVNYRWENASDLSTLTNDSDSTLEADLVFHNYNGDALATNWYDGNYTFNTNQPRPYIDTQAFDNEDEPVFTIGCSDAAALEADEDYYWIAYGNRTDSDSCQAKLNMQRGHRIIDSIYEETWNIFGDETVTVIPFNSWDTGDDPVMTFTY